MTKPVNVSSQTWQREHAETGLYPPVTYLLLDDLYLARQEGVRRTACLPEKLAEPVLRPDRPWEGRYVLCSNSFLYDPDEKLFKLWYHGEDLEGARQYPALGGAHRCAYATSQDCRSWDKPVLGLVEWNGSRANNFIAKPPTGGDGPMGSVLKNSREPDPARRYTGIGVARYMATEHDRAMAWWNGTTYLSERRSAADVPIAAALTRVDSPDGLTWSWGSRMLMSMYVVMDASTVHGFDEDLNAWLLWCRARCTVRSDRGLRKFRTIGVSVARTLDEIPYPQAIFAPDEQDPSDLQFDRLNTIKVPGGYVGLLVSMRASPEQAYRMEPQLVFSRDAHQWCRPVGRGPFLPCGEEGSWDELTVVPARPAQLGDDIFILYCGCNAGNGEYRIVCKDGRRQPEAADWGQAFSDGRLSLPGIGLATLRRDRWAAIEPIEQTGTLQTRPMYFANEALWVNADARRGALRAELVDTLGQPVPGLTLSDCDPFSGDSMEHAVSWRGQWRLPKEIVGNASLEGCPGRVMCIRFHLDRAKLFSFSC